MLNYPTTGVSAVINDDVGPDGTVQWKILTDTIEACAIVADYLIICADPFFKPDNPDSEVLRIANHRATFNGFDVTILNAENIISDELEFYYEGLEPPQTQQYKKEQRIRTCIRRIYEGAHAQHTYDGKLGYVLLIGDVDAGNLGMPSSYENGETHPSDYYFSCITKENEVYDPLGDLCIGRFCVDNNDISGFTELHNIVEKTIYFESEYSFEDWRNNVAHANGNSYLEEYFVIYYPFIEDLLFDESLTIVNWYDEFNNEIFQPVIDMLNLGAPVMMYDGHGNTDSWQDNLSIEELENNLSNTGKFPYVTSRACLTGWFDNGDEDCLAEALTTYSEDKGFVGFLGAARYHMDGGMHVIEDPPLFIQERIPYSIWQDQSFITDEFILETMIGIGAPLVAFLYNFFGDPALNIMAQGFEVTHDLTIPETASITEEVYLRSGNTIIMPSHSTLFFENDGKLIVEEDATLYIMNDATLSAISGTDDSLIVYGNLIVENNVHFSAAEDASFVIDIRNSELIESFTSATFENVTLTGIASTLIFSACNFTDSYVELHKVENNQYFFLNQSHFDNTPLKACRSGMVTYPNVGKIVISDCDFINGSGLSVIEISGYPHFQISGTTVSYSDGDGISLYYSGNAVGTLHEISNCEVHFTGNTVDDVQGIKAHYSRVDIENNYVHGNDIGLACMQRSSIRLTGNSQSNEEYQTQRIKDNISVQVFSDLQSFPYEFEYNSIFNDAEDDFVVSLDEVPQYSGYDIRNNYWGENFIPSSDLDPPNAYSYLPVWEPSWGGQKSTEEAKVLFYAAKQDIIDSSYAEAKAKFKQIIENYPGSKYQKAAVKEILLVTDLYDQDYMGLQMYLDTVPALWENDEIIGITEYIMIWCDIKVQNYTLAINWFEDRIINSVSFADSILSIIDLGHVYTLMQNGGNRWSGYTGNLPQYIPNSLESYEKNREYLIDLLMQGHSLSSPDTDEVPLKGSACFIQSYPNPVVNNQTTISFYMPEAAKVVVNVYNAMGGLLETVTHAFMTAGDHEIDWQTNDLKPGIYFAALKINGDIVDYQKIVVVK